MRDGLHLNKSKTKVMTVSIENTKSYDDVHVNNHNIEEVNYFIYLGSMLTNNYDVSMEIKQKTHTVKNTIVSILSIWKQRDHNMRIEQTQSIFSMFNSCLGDKKRRFLSTSYTRKSSQSILDKVICTIKTSVSY